MNDNPYWYGADAVLQQLDPHHLTSRSQLAMDAQHLMSALGSPINPAGLDNGSLALVLVCQFLREHGGTLNALTKAHRELTNGC